MKETVYKRIIQIEKDLHKNFESENNISLFTGFGGYPVFYYMLFALTKEKQYLNKFNKCIEKVFEMLNKSEYSLSYCDGLSGISYMLNFMQQRGVIRINSLGEDLKYIDKILLEYSLENTSSIDDIDFLHGTLGVAHYLNSRLKHNPKISTKTELLFTRIGGIINEDIIKAQSVKNIQIYEENLHKTNCGLAHGYVSYLLIFSDYLNNSKQNEYIRNVLSNSVECLLSFESKNDTTASVFPGIAINNFTADYSTHLGWCYGDQAVSLGLYKTSKVLNDVSLLKKAKNLAYKTLERDSLDKLLLMFKSMDAGFCHGLSSIAYICKKWHDITGDIVFHSRYLKFIEDILNLDYKKEGIGGFQKYMGNGAFETRVGLLDGSIGIGLVLIDFLIEDKTTMWDDLFLLN